MKECIESITLMVLMENHELKETDLADVVVLVKFKHDETTPQRQSRKATFVYEQEPELAVI